MNRSRSWAPGARTAGLTVVEMIMALAILAVLIGVAAMQVRTRSASAYSRDLKALVQQARFEAIKRNEPIAVVWNEASTEFRTVLGEPGSPCEESVVLYSASPDRYRRLEVVPGFDDGDGIVWLPSGQARSCNLGPFSERIARLSDGNATFTVTVSLTGRVTIE